jgi:hypothetical protein
LHSSSIEKPTGSEGFKSLTEHSSLDEFLNTAELANADFEAGADPLVIFNHIKASII